MEWPTCFSQFRQRTSNIVPQSITVTPDVFNIEADFIDPFIDMAGVGVKNLVLWPLAPGIDGIHQLPDTDGGRVPFAERG